VTPGLDLLASYAYQDRYVTDDTLNARFAPKHQVFTELNWHITPEWNFNTTLKAVIDRERPSLDPRPPVKDYTLVSLSLQRAHFLTRHSDLAFTVRDLLDADVRDPSDSATALPVRHSATWPYLPRRNPPALVVTGRSPVCSIDLDRAKVAGSAVGHNPPIKPTQLRPIAVVPE
jgi:hypothetical protein